MSYLRFTKKQLHLHDPLECNFQRLHLNAFQIKEKYGILCLEYELKQRTETQNALWVGWYDIQPVEICHVKLSKDIVQQHGIIVDIADRRNLFKKKSNKLSDPWDFGFSLKIPSIEKPWNGITPFGG
jgi:hypothetical protein